MELSANLPARKRLLEPIERISEVLFGLIMVLTFTCSLSIAEAGRSEVRTMLLAALGCNVAWGIIDAIMYLMGCLAEKARSLATVRTLRGVKDPRKAVRLISEALPSLFASTLGPSEFETLRNRIEQLPEPATHPTLGKADWLAALGVFFLVVLSTFPVVIPFMFIETTLRAHRVSNAIAIAMLFCTGYAFGRCTGYHPRGMGISMVVLGTLLVGLTIILGG